MNTAIIVDVNTEREKEGKVIIQEVIRTQNDKLVPTEDLNQIGLMSALCEGVCVLIHSANEIGLKEDYKSIEDCVNHIQIGFADASYISYSTKEVERILIEPLNAKIEIRYDKDEDCWNYDIENIKKVKDRYKEFQLSYSFWGKTLKEATHQALKDLYEKYEEYSRCNNETKY